MPKSKGKVLRAVGYCRTSGEGQRNNTSLPRQRQSIEATCKANGWKLIRHYVDECKSGSKIEGRDEFQAMIRDAANGEFDVIIPFDATRFARDGVDIVSTAKSLKSTFGIFTVDSKGQFDTRDYRNALRNFVAAGVSEHERLLIMERMIGGKIARAKENIPVTGRLPFGRTFDRKTNTWGLDERKVEAVRRIAERYLAGESLRKLAKDDDCPLSYPVLWRTLRRYSGSEWTVNFNIPELDCEESITFKIPPLFDGKFIRAIHRRMDDSRTRDARKPMMIHDYPLRGRIYCGGCGRMMTGAARPDGVRVYRHAWHNVECPYTPKPNVRADRIEPSVLGDLFDMLGNPAAIEKAVRSAIPDADRLISRRERLTEELARIGSSRSRVIDLVEDHSIPTEEIKERLRKLADKETRLKAQLAAVEAQVGKATDGASIRAYVEEIGEAIMVLDEEGNLVEGGNDVQSFLNMMQGENRAAEVRRLVEAAFALPQKDGSPSGVYLFPTGGKQGRSQAFRYEIRGCFGPARKSHAPGRRRSAPR